MLGEVERAFSIGDIVKVAGYGDKLFQVERITYTTTVGHSFAATDTLYDLLSVDSGEYLIGFGEDLQLVVQASKAEEYLRERKKERVQQARQKSVDELLDEYNDYMRLYHEFGDDSYRQAAEMAFEKIRELVRGGGV